MTDRTQDIRTIVQGSDIRYDEHNIDHVVYMVRNFFSDNLCGNSSYFWETRDVQVHKEYDTITINMTIRFYTNSFAGERLIGTVVVASDYIDFGLFDNKLNTIKALDQFTRKIQKLADTN